MCPPSSSVQCGDMQTKAAQGRGQHSGLGSCKPTGATETIKRELKRSLYDRVWHTVSSPRLFTVKLSEARCNESRKEWGGRIAPFRGRRKYPRQGVGRRTHIKYGVSYRSHVCGHIHM